MSSGCEKCQNMGHEMVDLRCAMEKMSCEKDAMQEKLKALMMQIEVLHCQIVKSEQTIQVKTATNDELGKQIMDFHEKNVKLEAENKEMKRKVEEMGAMMKEM